MVNLVLYYRPLDQFYCIYPILSAVQHCLGSDRKMHKLNLKYGEDTRSNLFDVIRKANLAEAIKTSNGVYAWVFVLISL